MVDNLKTILKKVTLYIKTNKLMFTFIITSLINSSLLRFFTVKNYFAIKPIFADLTFVLIICSFGYFLKPKHQFRYFIVWSIIFCLLCFINSIYYSNYISFASFSLLKTATQLGGYTDAVSSIFEFKDVIYFFQIFIMIFLHIQLKKGKYYKKVSEIEIGKVRFLNTIVISLISFGFFISMLTSTDISRLNKQWNRPSIVQEFGIYVYQVNDMISSLRTSVNEMFGFDEANKMFREYYELNTRKESKNKYTNLFEGKNVIVIHGESLQSFTMNLAFNGKELTPNLNKLASEGIYFSNFYSQESVGNSSDSEFTSLTSLLPSSSGTVFMNYFNRNYSTILKLLKEKDYYTFGMHGNNGSAWNRSNMYPYLGYDKFYHYTKDYEIDEVIGLGLSDKSFFRQSVEHIKLINEEHDNWYGTLVMLTNHTPFSGIEGFNDYSVDYITKELNPESNKVEEVTKQWLEGTKMGNYLKSANYADAAIGELMYMLEEADLLDDTVIVLYGDHDCKLKQSEFKKLYESEYIRDTLIDKEKLIAIDDFTYEINRKVPFIIWSKDIVDTKYAKEVKEVMGMIDIMPTLGNMLGVYNKYALGNDMFSIDENIVVFSSGNWMTNKLYYNSSKDEYRQLDLSTSISMDYIEKYKGYSTSLIEVSNAIITYDLIEEYEKNNEVNE